ncbi:hypothetical protein [Lentibacillus sediminis]|uniref:hypothetical protein n=1 Tax=Lentibacillus sediminis TaxID=1940529 RepID=UPI000C1BB5BF|nr:hypothetical protein [Lentibacillus sediminis]
MLLVLRVVFAVIAIGFSVYVLISDSNEPEQFPYMLFFLGALMLVVEISELKANPDDPKLKAKRKTNAIMSFFTSAFLFFVSVYLFFNYVS